MPITVLLVDDHVVVRQGLSMLLSNREDITVVGEAANGEEAVRLAQELRPDVILMDIFLPAVDGIEATRRIRSLGLPCFVLMLTSAVQPHQIQEAIRAGAIGYVLKTIHAQELIDALHRAARGQRAIDSIAADALMEGLTQQNELSHLTPRERDVLRLVALGQTNAQIARALVISEATVRSHIANLLSKLNLQDRAQMMIFALKRGIVSLDKLKEHPNSI